MERPSTLAMDEIEAVIQSIEEMEDAIKELKGRLRELPEEMTAQISTTEGRLEAAKYLYWLVPEISGTAIAQGLLKIGVHKLKQMIGPSVSMIHCDRCLESVEVRNRSHLQEIIKARRKDKARYAEGYKVLCDQCWTEVQQERHAEWEETCAQRAKRLHELETMSYAEYLETPEWQERRKRHLKSVGFKCQLCNTKDTILDVHHRTYERRGNEHFKDLIVMCRNCHGVFHASARSVK